MAISTVAAQLRKTGDTLDFTAADDVPCGAIIAADGMNCLALSPIARGDKGALKILRRGEVIEITTNDAIGSTAAGTAIYLIPASGLVTKSANDGGNPPTAYLLLGHARDAIGATALTFTVVCA